MLCAACPAMLYRSSRYQAGWTYGSSPVPGRGISESRTGSRLTSLIHLALPPLSLRRSGRQRRPSLLQLPGNTQLVLHHLSLISALRRPSSHRRLPRLHDRKPFFLSPPRPAPHSCRGATCGSLPSMAGRRRAPRRWWRSAGSCSRFPMEHSRPIVIPVTGTSGALATGGFWGEERQSTPLSPSSPSRTATSAWCSRQLVPPVLSPSRTRSLVFPCSSVRCAMKAHMCRRLGGLSRLPCSTRNWASQCWLDPTAYPCARVQDASCFTWKPARSWHWASARQTPATIRRRQVEN